MTLNLHRVFVVEQDELQSVQDKFLALAKKGKSIYEAVELGENEGGIPEELAELLFFTKPQYMKPSLVHALETLKERASKSWQAKTFELQAENIADAARFEKKLLALRQRELQNVQKELESCLSGEISLRDDVISGLTNVISPGQLEQLLDKATRNAYLLEKHNNIMNDTPDGFNRGVYVHGKKLTSKQVTGPAIADTFKRELTSKGAHEELADFLGQYLNQKYLLRGPNLFIDRFKQTFIAFKRANGLELQSCPHSMSHNVVVESDSSIIITYEHNYYDVSGLGVTGKPDAKAFLQYRIRRLPVKSGNPHDNIVVEMLDGYLDLYNPELNDFHVKRTVAEVIQKIRTNQAFTRNEQRNITISVNKYLLPNGDIDRARFANLNKDEWFLLLWNDPNIAHQLVTTNKKQWPASFFEQDSSDIIRDLTLIKQKHHYHPHLTAELTALLEIMELIETQNVSEIKRRMQQPATRKDFLRALVSVKDVPFIKQLIAEPKIKNFLNAKVITHFATRDEEVARRLLTPTFGERFRFAVKLIFNYFAPNEKLPHKRLASPHLKKIIYTHPSFWDNLFAKPKRFFLNFFGFVPKYRNKLEGNEIKELINPNQPRTESFLRAREVILYEKGKVLLNKAYPETRDPTQLNLRHPNIDVRERLAYFAENPHYDLEQLSRREPEYFTELHDQLTDDELLNFYRQKFQQLFETNDYRNQHLFLAVEDVWGDLPRRRQHWSTKIPADKLEVVQKALICVIADKNIRTGDVPASITRNEHIGKFATTMPLAEVFLTLPFIDEEPSKCGFNTQFFSKKQLHNLQRALINNKVTFQSLFVVEDMKDDDVANIAHQWATDSARHFPIWQRLPYSDPDLQQLIKTSPCLFKAFKKVLAHPALAHASDSDAIIKLGELAASEPTTDQLTRTYELITNIFNNERLVSSIEGTSLYAYLAKMLAHARFMLTLKNQNDLFLFKVTWKIVKHHFPDRLIELIRLLPANTFRRWLNEKSPNAIGAGVNLPNEASDLIDKLISDEAFYEQFMVHQPQETKKLLLSKTNHTQLALLITTRNEFGSLYLRLISTALQDQEAESLAIIPKFVKFLAHCNFSEFTQLVLKNSNFVTILSQFKQFETDYLPKILKVIGENHLVISKTDKLAYANVHPQIAAALTKLGSVSLSTADEELKANLANVLNAHPADVGRFLLTALKEKPWDKIEFLFENNEVMARLIDGALDSNSSSSQITEIFQKLPDKYVNVLLEKLILNTRLRSALANEELHELFCNKANLELLGRFLILRGLPLETSFKGISRIAADSELFERCLPYLRHQEFFPHWCCYQAGHAPQSLFSLGKNGKQLVSSEEFERYISSGKYHFKDLVTLIRNQLLSKEMPRQPVVETILSNNADASRVFLSKSFEHGEDLLLLVLTLLEKAPNSLLLENIMRDPHISYLLSTLPTERLEILFEKLRSLNISEKLMFGLDRLAKLFIQNGAVRRNIIASPQLLASCLDYGLQRAQHLSRSMLLLCFNESSLASLIINKERETAFIQVFNQSYTRYLNAFKLEDAHNDLVELFLRLTEINKSYHSLGIDQAINNIIQDQDGIFFTAMLAQDVKPSLKVKLLVELLNRLRLPEECTADERRVATSIKQHLNRLRFFGENNRGVDFSSFLHALTADELIELYLADGVDLTLNEPRQSGHNVPQQRKDYFRQRITTDHILIDKLLLLGSDDKLLGLLTAHPHLHEVLIEKILSGNQVGRQLVSRLLTRTSGSNPLVSSILMHSKGDQLRSVVNLMAASREIYASILNEIMISPPWLATGVLDKTLFASYVYFLVERNFFTNPQEVPLDLLKILKVSDTTFRRGHEAKTTVNILSHYLYARITNEQTPAAEKAKLIGYFAVPQLRTSLFHAAIRSLPYSELKIFIQNPEIEEQFIAYLNDHPTQLSQLFEKDHDSFEDFFFHSKHKMKVYLLLCERLPKSSLLPLVQQILKDPFNEILAKLTVLNANPVELARAWNFEALQGRGNEPLTKYLFNQRLGVLPRLLSALSSIDNELILTHKIINGAMFVADSPQPEINVNNLEIFMNNFDLVKQRSQIVFRADPSKQLTLNQRLAYLNGLKLKHFARLIERRNVIDGNRIGKELDVLYLTYCSSVHMVAHINRDGFVTFRDTEERIPLEDAVPYLEGLARFFYMRMNGTESIKQAIEGKANTRKILIRTVDFNEAGDASFTFDSPTSHVPVYYQHCVLYAYCFGEHPLTLPVAKAFLKSVDFKDNKITFKGVQSAQPLEVPPAYRAKVIESIAKIWAANPGTLQDSTTLNILATDPTYDLRTLLLGQPILATNILKSVYLSKDGEIRGKDTKRVVPANYKALVLELLGQVQKFEDRDIYTLYLFNKMRQEKGPLANFADEILTLILEDKVRINDKGVACYAETDEHGEVNETNMHVPDTWMRLAIDRLQQRFADMARAEVYSLETIFLALIAKFSFKDLLKKPSFIRYIESMITFNEEKKCAVFTAGNQPAPFIFGALFEKLLILKRVNIESVKATYPNVKDMISSAKKYQQQQIVFQEEPEELEEELPASGVDANYKGLVNSNKISFFSIRMVPLPDDEGQDPDYRQAVGVEN